jgi:(S)-mandelate dehydrogenase
MSSSIPTGGPGIAAPASVAPKHRGGSGTEGLSDLELRFPTIEDLRLEAQRRVPKFAFDFVAGGCGENKSRDRNRTALDAIEIVPRYGLGAFAVDTAVTLFGKRYAAPIGSGPMGMGGLLWPRMEYHIAAAAQAVGVPYVLATPAAAPIEKIAAVAPDVFWFQTYGAPKDDYRITFDLLRRAQDAGAHGLLVTIDSPVRAKRPQDARNRLSVPFKPNLKTVWDIATHPAWAMEMRRVGTPCAENFIPYTGKANPKPMEVSAFASSVQRGGYSWEVIKRLREAWKKPLLIKGVLHPADAEMARQVGADGILVSNHGGRTFDGAPPAIDMLPIIRRAVPGMTLMLDSGMRGGLDVVRGLSLGADFVLAGRPFQWGVGAAGPEGARHVLDIFLEEIRQAMGQIGAHNVAETRGMVVHHPRSEAYARLLAEAEAARREMRPAAE